MQKQFFNTNTVLLLLFSCTLYQHLGNQKSEFSVLNADQVCSSVGVRSTFLLGLQHMNMILMKTDTHTHTIVGTNGAGGVFIGVTLPFSWRKPLGGLQGVGGEAKSF